MWRLLNNQCVKEKNQVREIKKKIPWDSENGKITYQNLWDSSKAVLRGRFIENTCQHQETKKVSKKQPSFTPQGTRKRKTHEVWS